MFSNATKYSPATETATSSHSYVTREIYNPNYAHVSSWKNHKHSHM